MNNQPLADRMRPETIDDMVGQTHLIGKNGVIRKMLDNNRISNMIFSGPPGTGKTTAANIIAKQANMPLYRLNATTASLADVKEIATNTSNIFSSGGILLYLDEIQYFNKKQQQSLLEYIEDGRITLIASTTENPYYAIYNAILSRSSVFEFKPIKSEECIPALQRALRILNEEHKTEKTADEEVLRLIASHSGGDVRRAIGILENVFYICDDVLSKEEAEALLPSMTGYFDRDGDVHYNLLSCLQKSIRGSDPDAAVFYLAKILAGGDLISVCRRLLVIASEDIGLAYPMAAAIVKSCTDAAKEIGLPEACIPLANATILLATSPKSNSAYLAYAAAKEDIAMGRGAEVPAHLRSPLFKGYKYPHDYKNHYVDQTYLPSDLIGKRYYNFGDNKLEQTAKAYYDMIRKKD